MSRNSSAAIQRSSRPVGRRDRPLGRGRTRGAGEVGGLQSVHPPQPQADVRRNTAAYPLVIPANITNRTQVATPLGSLNQNIAAASARPNSKYRFCAVESFSEMVMLSRFFGRRMCSGLR